MMPRGQIFSTFLPLAFLMLAGVQFVRMSAKSWDMPPERALATIMPTPFLESFSVATGMAGRYPFQSNIELSRDSATSKFGWPSVHWRWPWVPAPAAL